MSFLKWTIPALGFLFTGCYASNEELFPISARDTLPIGGVVSCVYPKSSGSLRYQVEHIVSGEKSQSQYRFEGGLMYAPRFVAFHKIGTSTWIFAARTTTVGGSALPPYTYGVLRLKEKGEFEIIQHADALRERLAGVHGVEVRESVLIGDVVNQKRFVLALAAEPGEVGAICASN